MFKDKFLIYAEKEEHFDDTCSTLHFIEHEILSSWQYKFANTGTFWGFELSLKLEKKIYSNPMCDPRGKLLIIYQLVCLEAINMNLRHSDVCYF